MKKMTKTLTAAAACAMLFTPVVTYAVPEAPSDNMPQSSATSGSVNTPAEETQSGSTAPDAQSAPGGSVASVASAKPAAAPTPIAEIQRQGEGDDSVLVGQTTRTIGVVTALHPRGEDGLSSTLDGLTIQTPGTGGTWNPNRQSSDGLFVYVGKKKLTMPQIGECVEVTGTVVEYPRTTANVPASTQSLTQLNVSKLQRVNNCEPVTPTPISAVPTPEQMEALESMLVTPQGKWTITDNYQTNQYGTLTLTPGTEPLKQATDVVAPGDEARAYEAANAAKSIALDDGTNTNLQRGQATSVPYAYLANGSPARVGYHVTFDAPVLLEPRHGSFVFQPTRMVAAHPDRSPVTIAGERPAAPQVAGDVRVATFNVLNYFTDLGQDEPGCDGYADREGALVTAKKCAVRGAWSTQAFENQQAKIVHAINALNADVVGLEEIENPVGTKVGTDRDASLKALVEALNAKAGSQVWAYVPSPTTVPANEDAIRVAFIYRVATITPVGESMILDDPAFTGLARQPLAQRFSPIVTDTQKATEFVVIANHFKSKGSVPRGMEDGNKDTGDGQGNSNAIRVAQARALAAFAAQFDGTPTLLVGDFNAYSQEDPLAVLRNAGWNHESAGTHPSYVYQGRSGSLDHVFSNAAAHSRIAGIASWSLNAEESIAFEYSRANYNAFLAVETDNPYRSSDHNPEIVGLNVITDTTPAPSPKPEPDPKPGPDPSVPPTSNSTPTPKTPTLSSQSMKLAKTGVDMRAATAAIGIALIGLMIAFTSRRWG